MATLDAKNMQMIEATGMMVGMHVPMSMIVQQVAKSNPYHKSFVVKGRQASMGNIVEMRNKTLLLKKREKFDVKAHKDHL